MKTFVSAACAVKSSILKMNCAFQNKNFIIERAGYNLHILGEIFLLYFAVTMDFRITQSEILLFCCFFLIYMS